MCVSENVSVTLDIVLDIALCLQLPRMIRSSHGHVCSSSHCVRAARLKYIPPLCPAQLKNRRSIVTLVHVLSNSPM